MADWSSRNIMLTTKGAAAISKVQSGSGKLTITKVVASEQYVSESTLREVTSLSVENLPLTIVDRHEVPDGGSVIQVQLNNLDLDNPFVFNEIGVFATHSDNPSEEFLYIIAQVDADTGDRIPLYSTTPITATYDIYLYNVGADNIEVTISSSGLVTYEALNEACGMVKRSTSYAEGDIKYSSSLPIPYYLRCKVKGTTSSSSIVVPSGIKEGDTITDGTVTWEAIKLVSTDELQTRNWDSLNAKVILPSSGSTQNSVGAADRPWKSGHFDQLKLNGGDLGTYLSESTGYGIVSGCEPSISGLTVKVGAGVIHLADGTRKEIVQTNITLDNADPTNPRIDLVYIDSTGAVAKVTGKASARPVVSSVPAGGISVCNIILAAGATTGTIINSRMMLNTYQYCVNVKSYGAVGDGMHDDTTAIQTAINYAQSQLENSAIVYFPRGEYKVTSTLHVDIQRANMLGDAVTLTYYGTDSTGLLHIDGYSNNTGLPIPDINNHRVRFIRGFTFNNKSGANDSIAVYSGTTEYTTESFAHGARDFIIDSCAFNFFNKGVYISYNSYLFSLHYCSSYATDYVIYDRQASNNSGENIVIYRGVFTDFDTAIKVQSPNTQIRVHNTSFDGKGNQILDMETLAGDNHCDVVSFVDCHFECGGPTEKPLFRVVSNTGFQRVNIVRATSFLGVRYPYMVETGGNDYVYITDSYFNLLGGETTSWGNSDRVVVRNTKVYGPAPLMYGHSLIKQPDYGWILTDGTLKYGTGFELLQPKFWIYRHGNSWDTTGTRVVVNDTNKIFVDTAVHRATEKSSLAIQADYDKYFQAALLAPCEQDYCYTFIYKIMVYVDKKYEGLKLSLLPVYYDTPGGDYTITWNSTKVVEMDDLTVGDWTAIYAYTPWGTAIPPTAKYIGLQIEIHHVDGYSDSKNVKINIGEITYQRY